MADRKRGRRAKLIDETQVLGLKSIGLSWKRIATLIGVSERTLRDRRKSFQNVIVKTRWIGIT